LKLNKKMKLVSKTWKIFHIYRMFQNTTISFLENKFEILRQTFTDDTVDLTSC